MGVYLKAGMRRKQSSITVILPSSVLILSVGQYG